MGIIAVVISMLLFPSQKENVVSPRSIDEIKQSGILKAVTEYNSVSFHAMGDDSISGFHYELLKAFAKDKGLTLEMTPLMSLEERWVGVQEGTYDILANDIPITLGSKDSLLFTKPILLSKQVLIQRKPDKKGSDSLFIKNHLDLAHKTLHIVKGSPYKSRIKNLSNEIGDTIFIKEIEKYGPEQLLALVAHGDIDYAVCDESIALARLEDFPQIDISTPISFSQFHSWGVNKKNKALLDTLNSWLEQYINSIEFTKIKKKYYKTNR